MYGNIIDGYYSNLNCMKQKDKIELRRTTWFVVNIKARKNQKPSH